MALFFYEGVDMDIKTVLTVLQIAVASANICVMGFAFVKFLGKPHNSLEVRVSDLEKRVSKLEDNQGNNDETFKSQNITNEVLQRCLLALVEFEIQYCIARGIEITDELRKAKEELHDYLAKR